MRREEVEGWVSGYERAWRSSGTDQLTDLFAADVSYLPSPWSTTLRGLQELAAFWDGAREGPDEQFEMTSEVVAVDGRTAVVRLFVEYGAPGHSRWRDLWVIEFDDSGRCTHFEEWPFAPGQRDGHEQD